ncbi:MAG: SurA N-terminal domain-containing protein, partial [Myxococcota bacterium]
MIINLLAFILLSTNPEPSYTDGIAAIVGKKIILASEVKQNIKPQLPKLCQIPEKGKQLATLNKFWEEALSAEINMILMELEAEKHNIEVGPEQVNAAVQMVIKKNNFSSLKELKQALAKKNVSYFLMRKQLKNSILRQQLLANVVHAKVNVGEEAIKSYYLDKVRKAGAEENIDFQQIFIPHNKNPKKHIKIIKKALKNKVDFKTIALK